MSSKLLLKERPLLVNPKLAELIGLNEAIILQQIEYWLEVKRKKKDTNFFIDGSWWTYNSYRAWHEQFPFWSRRTIRRALNRLEAQGIIRTANYNKMGADRTKWYTIDYKKLDQCHSKAMWTKCPNEPDKMTAPIP